MTSKIFRSVIFVAAVVLLCSLGTVMGVLYDHFSGEQVAQLRDELSLAVTGAEQYGNAFLENVEASRFRITWVAADGTVLFDTQVDVSGMENHGDREEIREALLSGSGSSIRYSTTLTENTLYEAQRLSDGSVLRISADQASAGSLLLDTLPLLLLVAVIAIALSAFLAKRMAKWIVRPLDQLDLEHPLSNDAYEELTPMLRRINQQHLQISAQLETLRRKADEFEQITNNMPEGLILLDGECRIRSINSTARLLFGVDDECIGKDFLTVDRSRELRIAVNMALDKGRGIARTRRGGRDYMFELSRIESGGTVIGAVILTFDITEVLSAEQLRREFSANVSHELKTPLQSIIGSAELLETGLAKPEDAPRFVGHIRQEASRLVTLIEDIIRLSQLDEGVSLPTEDVELLAVAEEVVQTLQNSAQRHQVTLKISGEGCRLKGVRRLLYEIIYNLCDNAIKYNMPGGSVEIRAEKDRLTVTDTGIGIAPEHQDRVFERFYRVDKSHSKASGGTGLGLSIVKHAVQYHNATIRLESAPGKGTSITVLF